MLMPQRPGAPRPGGAPAPRPMGSAPGLGQSQGYEDPMNMPEVAGGPQGQPNKGENPVLQALRTLSLYVATASQRQDPKAPQLAEALKGFVSTLSGGGEAAPQGPAAPAAPESPAPAGAPGQMIPAEGGNEQNIPMADGEPDMAPAKPGPRGMAFDPFSPKPAAKPAPKAKGKAKQNQKPAKVMF